MSSITKLGLLGISLLCVSNLFQKKIKLHPNPSPRVSLTDDVLLYHAVHPKSIATIKSMGLLSAKRIIEDPKLLHQARGDIGKVRMEKWADMIRDKVKAGSDAVNGSSAFFTKPDFRRIPTNHVIRARGLIMIRINVSQLLKDKPNTRLVGVELYPYPSQSRKKRVKDLSLKEVRMYTNKKPSEIWKDYEKKENYYAANVPHVFIVTPDGCIPSKYLVFEKT